MIRMSSVDFEGIEPLNYGFLSKYLWARLKYQEVKFRL